MSDVLPYESHRPAAGKHRYSLLAKIFMSVGGGLVGLVLLFGIFAPSLCRSRETANRVKCASNLRQIGQAILLYAHDNGGHYPQKLGQLLTTQDITVEVFTCPSSNDEKAPGETPVQQAAKLETEPRHLSYIYVGHDLTSQSPAETPVCYEAIDNHDNDGSNVLFVDGHVEWIGRRELAKLPGVKLPVSK